MAGGIYDNKIRVVNSNATDLNTEITTQNAANYWLQRVEFDEAGLAVMLFTKMSSAAFENPAPQKINELDIDQTDIDADIAAETPNGYYPTGIFIDVNTAAKVWILYQQLEVPPAP